MGRAGGAHPEPRARRRGLKSHETFCVLDTGDANAHIELTIYFRHRDPVGVPARRTRHVRADDLEGPEVPRHADSATLIRSDVPVVVRHTRLDSRRESLALLRWRASSGG